MGMYKRTGSALRHAKLPRTTREALSAMMRGGFVRRVVDQWEQNNTGVMTSVSDDLLVIVGDDSIVFTNSQGTCAFKLVKTGEEVK